MKSLKSLSIAILTGLVFMSPVCAAAENQTRNELALPAMFSDNAVFQRDKEVRVWGWSAPKDVITVQFNGQTVEAVAEENGRWSLCLKSMEAGGPFTLNASSRETGKTLLVKNILIGEVFQFSGQSNMALTMGSALRSKIVAERAIIQKDAAEADFPRIRFITAPNNTFATEPQEDIDASWNVCSPESVKRLSAVAFYFARILHRELGVPVGIVRASHFGGPIEGKLPLDDLRSLPRGEAFYQQRETVGYYKGKMCGRYPAGDYNGVIAPVIRYSKRAVVWYQGEHNATSRSDARFYRTYLELLFKSYRRESGDAELPFVVIQLPAFGGSGSEFWPDIRASQTAAALNDDRVYFVTTLDTGEKNEIHPCFKKPIGERAAYEALGKLFGKAMTGNGPVYAGMHLENDTCVVSFTNVGGGLVSKSGPQLSGFSISSDGETFKPAVAEIVDATVVVHRSDMSEPEAVRYAWEGFPEVSLFTKEGLPASPFSAKRKR